MLFLFVARPNKLLSLVQLICENKNQSMFLLVSRFDRKTNHKLKFSSRFVKCNTIGDINGTSISTNPKFPQKLQNILLFPLNYSLIVKQYGRMRQMTQLISLRNCALIMSTTIFPRFVSIRFFPFYRH